MQVENTATLGLLLVTCFVLNKQMVVMNAARLQRVSTLLTLTHNPSRMCLMRTDLISPTHARQPNPELAAGAYHESCSLEVIGGLRSRASNRKAKCRRKAEASPQRQCVIRGRAHKAADCRKLRISISSPCLD